MLLSLPSGLCAEYKECFSLYDKQQRGKIKATDLMVVMRCLGASPTPGEAQRHLQTHGIGEWAGPGWRRRGLGWWVGHEPCSWGPGEEPDRRVQMVEVQTGQRSPAGSCGGVWPGVLGISLRLP